MPILTYVETLMSPTWSVSHPGSRAVPGYRKENRTQARTHARIMELRSRRTATGAYRDEVERMQDTYEEKYGINATVDMCKSAVCAFSVLRSLVSCTAAESG